MKKKDTFIVIILGIITVAVIFAGFRYRQNKQAELINNGDYSATNQSEHVDSQKEKQAKFLAAFDDNRESNTVANFIQYVAYAKNEAKVAFYGEMNEEETWAIDAMTQVKQDLGLEKVQTAFVSTLDSETMSDKVGELSDSNPAVIFFYPPMPIYDYILWTDEGPIEKDNISEIIATYAQMKETFPESLIVMVTPLPREANPELETDESWHQVDVDQLVSQAEANGIPVLNLHDAMMAYLETGNMVIADLYSEEGLAATAVAGITATFLENLKTTALDTTSAFIIDGEPARMDITVESESEPDSAIEEESAEEIVEETQVEQWVEEEPVEDARPVYTPPVTPQSETSSSSATTSSEEQAVPETTETTNTEETVTEEDEATAETDTATE